MIDNDGDLDVVVSVMDEKPLLLEHNGANKSNWLTIQLTGTRSNRMAVGARGRLPPVRSANTRQFRLGEACLPTTPSAFWASAPRWKQRLT